MSKRVKWWEVMPCLLLCCLMVLCAPLGVIIGAAKLGIGAGMDYFEDVTDRMSRDVNEPNHE